MDIIELIFITKVELLREIKKILLPKMQRNKGRYRKDYRSVKTA